MHVPWELHYFYGEWTRHYVLSVYDCLHPMDHITLLPKICRLKILCRLESLKGGTIRIVDGHCTPGKVDAAVLFFLEHLLPLTIYFVSIGSTRMEPQEQVRRGSMIAISLNKSLDFNKGRYPFALVEHRILYSLIDK